MKYTNALIILSAALLSACSVASAREGKGMGRPPQPVFSEFDLNGDNSITEQEFYEARNKRIGERAREGRKMHGLANMPSFADIDANGDGQVSQAEFNAFLGNHMRKRHQK